MSKLSVAVALFICIATPLESDASELRANGNCAIGKAIPGNTFYSACTDYIGPAILDGKLAGASISSEPFAEASFQVTRAEFGHTGAISQTFLTDNFKGFGYARLASASIGISSFDEFSVMSATLPIGAQVEAQLSYSLEGKVGINIGEFDDAQKQNAYSNVTGFLNVIANPGPGGGNLDFCLGTGGTDCQFTFQNGINSFKISEAKTVWLTIGGSYVLESFLSLVSEAALDQSLNCGKFNTCQAASYASVENSLFSYLTPNDTNFYIVTASGHDYSIAAVPEPATLSLLLSGAIILVGRSMLRPAPKTKVV